MLTRAKNLRRLQPAGKYLGEEYHRAGGVPAVVNELIKAGKIRENTMTVNGKSLADNCRGREIEDHDVIFPYEKPMLTGAGFINLKGNLFEQQLSVLSGKGGLQR